MKISLLQMDVVLGEPKLNQHKVTELVTQAMRQSPDVIALPEMWNTGFFPQNVEDCCDRDGQMAKALLGNLARRFQVNIVGGSVANVEAGRLVNTNYVFNRQGEVISQYNKIHLFSPAGEDGVFTAGNKISLFSVDGVGAAVVICYDLRFCELIRMLALRDIAILFIPAAWPNPRRMHWDTLVKARAIENQIFVAAINNVGSAGMLSFCGGSMAVDPWGEVLGGAEAEEAIVTCTVDLAVLKEIRSKMPVFKDRKPHVYDFK